jgi:hypothetical protein
MCRRVEGTNVAAIHLGWEGTDEDWGVGAEYLLLPSRVETSVDSRDVDAAAWEEARCVPLLEGEDPFATVAAARVLLGELFARREVAIYSSYFAGEYGLLITTPDLDMTAALRDGRPSLEKELVYLCGESASQWEFLLAFGSPVLPSSENGSVHVESWEDGEATWSHVLDVPDREFTLWHLDAVTESDSVWRRATWSGLSPSEQVAVVMNVSEDGRHPAHLVAALARLHPGTSPEALAALELSGLSGELETFTDPLGVVGYWLRTDEEVD